MGGTVDWQGRALATLRRRMAAAEADRSDLVAFAQGHAGAVRAIHAGVLALAAADDRAALIRVVVRDWPGLLGVDEVTLALAERDGAIRCDLDGMAALEPRLFGRYLAEAGEVSMRCVARGHPLFGRTGELVRAEALIGFAADAVEGVLLLGQYAPSGFDCAEAGSLLGFLGQMLCAMLERCPAR